MLTNSCEKEFIAVIGDIRKSRQLENRGDIQEELREVLREINKEYANDITAKFVITLGDEFQGLLSNGKNILKIIQKIKMRLYPAEVRYGIGIGEIVTRIDTKMALGADGPGYYHARNAVETIRKNEKKQKAVLSDIRLENGNENDPQIRLLNTIFELLRVIETSWASRQREIIWTVLQNHESQVQAAQRLGITQSSVQKGLAKGNFYVYDKALKEIEVILGDFNDG